MEKAMNWLVASLVFAIIMGGLVILLSFPTMWLWNWLMPELFGLKAITWIQALGLTALAKCIFPSGSSSSSSSKS